MKLQHELHTRIEEYPKELQEIALNAQKKVLERLGVSLEGISNIPDRNTDKQLIVASYIGYELIRKFAQYHFLSDITETDNGKGIDYTLDDIFDILQTLPEELSCGVLMRCVDFKKASTIEELLRCLRESKKDVFTKLLGEEKVDRHQLNKLLTHLELTQEIDASLITTAQENPNSFADQFSILLSDLIGTSCKENPSKDGYVSVSQNQREVFHDVILQLINQTSINDEDAENDDNDYRDDEESLLDGLSPQVLCSYQFVVSAFVSYDNYLDSEKDIFLKYVKTPEIAPIYDLVEDAYFNLKGTSPFINLSRRQLSVVVRFINDQAKDKSEENSEEPKFCRANVLRTVVALSKLGKYELPDESDKVRTKQLCEWMDLNVTNSDLYYGSGWSKVKELLRKNYSNEDPHSNNPEKIKKIIAALNKLGIS